MTFSICVGSKKQWYKIFVFTNCITNQYIWWVPTWFYHATISVWIEKTHIFEIEDILLGQRFWLHCVDVQQHDMCKLEIRWDSSLMLTLVTGVISSRAYVSLNYLHPSSSSEMKNHTWCLCASSDLASLFIYWPAYLSLHKEWGLSDGVNPLAHLLVWCPLCVFSSHPFSW